MPIMPMKYANNCKVCGARLDVGTTAFMEPSGKVKKDGNRAWEFTCQSCYEEVEAVELPSADVNFDNLNEILGAIAIVDKGKSLSGTVGPFSTPPMPPITKPLLYPVMPKESVEAEWWDNPMIAIKNKEQKSSEQMVNEVLEEKISKPYTKEWIVANAIWGRI